MTWTRIFRKIKANEGFPGGASGKEPTCRCRRHKRCRFNPWVGKIPWRRKWQPTPYSFLENSTDRGACSVHGVTESDMTEVTRHTQSKWGPQYSQRDLHLSDCFLFFLYLKLFSLLPPYTSSLVLYFILLLFNIIINKLITDYGASTICFTFVIFNPHNSPVRWVRLSPLSQNHRCSDGWCQVLNLAVWFHSP